MHTNKRLLTVTKRAAAHNKQQFWKTILLDPILSHIYFIFLYNSTEEKNVHYMETVTEQLSPLYYSNLTIGKGIITIQSHKLNIKSNCAHAKN